MINFFVVGRTHNRLEYIGAVTNEFLDRHSSTDRNKDIVQSLPCTSPSEAIARGHELRGLLLEQEITDGIY